MEQSSLIKVVGAFVAGVVIALGSALIYVRVSEGMQPRAAIQTSLPLPQPPPAELPDAGQDTPDINAQPNPASAPEASNVTSPPPAPVEHIKHREPANREPANKVARHEAPKQRIYHEAQSVHEAQSAHEAPKRATIEIAQNTPPPPVTTADVAQQPQSTPAPEPPRQPQQQPEAAPAPPADAPLPSAPPQPQPHVVTLQSGLAIGIRLGETLSTDQNYTGDTFRATLESPIIMDGFIIADKGSKVLGRIVNVQKSGHFEGVSGLTLALTEINTTDGQRVKIETTTYDKRGTSNNGQEAAKIAGGAALGAIIGAAAGGGKGAAIGAGVGGAAGTGVVIATHGKPAVLPTETRLTFRLTNPVTITEKLNH